MIKKIDASPFVGNLEQATLVIEMRFESRALHCFAPVHWIPFVKQTLFFFPRIVSQCAAQVPTGTWRMKSAGVCI